MIELDDYDIRILASLQEDNQRTSQALAERVHLSPVQCLRRTKRLRDAGVIVGDHAVLNPEAVGCHLMMVVLVTLEREQRDVVAQFKQSMLAAPEVLQCHYVTGEADFVLMVTAPDMSAYEQFTQRVFFQNPEVRRFSTMVVMDRVKSGSALPLTRAGAR
jgi:Lrp/AsnC family leucine-responsive transcriptional regulator